MSEIEKNPFSTEEFNNAYQISVSSNVVKSTRRILFVQPDDPNPKYFTADHVGGSGSGILIKMGEVFFLLTARHVITTPYGEDFRLGDEFHNYSPFWVPSRTTENSYNRLESFLYPSKIWDIGDQVNTELDAIDTSDICLIELALPNQVLYPDHYLEINSPEDVEVKENLFDGKFLNIVGYPNLHNEVTYEGVENGFTHTTFLKRHIYPGVCFLKEQYIDHEYIGVELSHDDVTGMSGGAVVGIYEDVRDIKLSGILITNSGGKSRFIPCYVFIDALINYKRSNSYIVDPATVPREELLDNPEMLAYADSINDSFLKDRMELLKGRLIPK